MCGMEWSIQEVSQRKEKEKQVEKKKEAPVFPIRGATKATGAVTSASEGHWVRLSVDTLVIKCNICYQFLIRVDSRSQASSSMRTHQQKRRRMTHRPLLSSYVSWTAQCVIVALIQRSVPLCLVCLCFASVICYFMRLAKRPESRFLVATKRNNSNAHEQPYWTLAPFAPPRGHSWR